MTAEPGDAWEQLNSEVTSCTRCARLVEWRERVAREKRAAYREFTYWGKPVPGFGDLDPRVFIVGLAPGAHGANRTGRMFTGDSAGDTLAAALCRAGFANRPTSSTRDDGLELRGAYMTAVARCAPPDNKPDRQELANCQPFLLRELELFPSVEVVLALGHVAFSSCLRLYEARGVDVPAIKPVHGECYQIAPGLPWLAFSYHPSRQNTQTGRLTPGMLDALFAEVKTHLSPRR